MGYRPYKGPVSTLEQAMFADLPVSITCESCGHVRRMHAFKAVRMIAPRIQARALPLLRPVPGVFFCSQCRKRVTVIISAPILWTQR